MYYSNSLIFEFSIPKAFFSCLENMVSLLFIGTQKILDSIKCFTVALVHFPYKGFQLCCTFFPRLKADIFKFHYLCQYLTHELGISIKTNSLLRPLCQSRVQIPLFMPLFNK